MLLVLLRLVLQLLPPGCLENDRRVGPFSLVGDERLLLSGRKLAFDASAGSNLAAGVSDSKLVRVSMMDANGAIKSGPEYPSEINGGREPANDKRGTHCACVTCNHIINGPTPATAKSELTHK